MIKNLILAGALVFVPVNQSVHNVVHYAQEVQQIEFETEYKYVLGEDEVSLIFFEDMHFEIKCGSVAFNGEYKLNEEGRIVLMLKGVSIYEISIDNEKHSFAPHKCLIENEQGFIDAFIEQTKDIISKYMGMEIFGSFTLGTLCTIAVTLLFNILKSKKINEKTNSNIQASEAAINAAQQAVNTLNKELASLSEKTEREISQIRNENKNYQTDFASMNSNLSDLTKVVERNSEALENIGKANKKMDAILKNQVLIACNTDKFVSDGTAKALEEEAKHLEE